MRLNFCLPVSLRLDRAILLSASLIHIYFCFSALFIGSSFFRLLSGLTGAFFVIYFLMVYRVRTLIPSAIALLMLGVAVLKADSDFLASTFFILTLFSSLCLAILIRDYDLGCVLIKLPLLLFSLFLLYLFLVLGYDPDDFNDVFDGYSRNGLGAVLLAFSLGYVWYCYEKRQRPSLILGGLVLFLMLPLYGRANILGGVVVFLLILYMNFGATGWFLLGLIFIVSLIFGFDYISEYLSAKTKFSAGFESPRFEMLQDYFSETDLSSLFVGTDLSIVNSIVDHGGNTHNAFLRAHSYFGFVSVVLVIGLAIGVVLLVSNGFFVLAIIALAFIARAFLDIIYLGNIFDFLMLGPFLYFYRPLRSNLYL